MGYWWPDVFLTGELPEDVIFLEAKAMCLIGWVFCMTGNAIIPENFGKGMAAIHGRFPELAKLMSSSKPLKKVSP